MGKINIYLLMSILLSYPTLANIIISEIMANPIADESLNEWIELHNNGLSSVNLSTWIIGDNKDNDTLEGGLYGGVGTILEPGQYALVTDETTRVYNNFDVSPYAIKLYVNDASIGNGLKNAGETIYLYNNNQNLINNITYSEVTEGNTYALINNSWHEARPTPGYNNNGSIIYAFEGECNWKIEILLNKTLFDNETEFEFKVRASKLHGNKTNISVVITIDNIYGNNKKTYRPWKNETTTRQRTSNTYSPNLAEEIYIIKANLTTICADSDLSNNYDEKLFTIADEPPETESSLEIEKIYDLGNDNIAKFGQTIRIKANVYKGDTTKNSIVLYVENRKDRISKQSKTNVYTKYTEYTLVIPIQLKPNCNRGFDDDDYYVYIKGLDKEHKKKIEVEDITDSLCEEIKTTVSSARGIFNYELTGFPEEIENNNAFVSKLKLDNNGDNDISLEIWSYVYRGSKSYSGEREENKIKLVLPQHYKRTMKLYNTVSDAEPGDYKFKIKIRKDNQKTTKDITKDIKIVSPEKKASSSLKTPNAPAINKGIVYESTTIKTGKLVPYLIIILTTFLSIILIWKR